MACRRNNAGSAAARDIITKSGANVHPGSFRSTLNNDDWRAQVKGNGNFAPLAPGQTTAPCNSVTGIGGTQIPDPDCFSGDAKVDNVVPDYQYVFGGPIVKNHLTFFTAGRFENQQAARNTVTPVNIPYTFEDRRKRYEIKGNASINARHRFEGVYQRESGEQANNSFGSILHLASLYDRQTPLEGYQVSYNGVLSSQLSSKGDSRSATSASSARVPRRPI